MRVRRVVTWLMGDWSRDDWSWDGAEDRFIWKEMERLGFVWLWAIASGLIAGGLQELQLFESPVMGAIEGAFVAEQQGEAWAVVGELLEGVGHAVNGFDVNEGVPFEVGVDRVGKRNISLFSSRVSMAAVRRRRQRATAMAWTSSVSTPGWGANWSR